MNELAVAFLRARVTCLVALFSCLTAACAGTCRDANLEGTSESKDVSAVLGDSIRFMGGVVLPDGLPESVACKGVRILTRNNLDYACTDEVNWQSGMGEVFKTARGQNAAGTDNNAARFLICRMQDPNAANPSEYWSTADECRLLSAKQRGPRLEILFAHIRHTGPMGAAPAPVDLYISIDRTNVAALGVTMVEASFVALRLSKRGRETLFDLSQDKEISPISIFFEDK